MFCPKCGRELPDEASFCGYCGHRMSDPAENDTPINRFAQNPYGFGEQPDNGYAPPQNDIYNDTYDGGYYPEPDPEPERQADGSVKSYRLMIPAIIAAVCCVCTAALVLTVILTGKDKLETDDGDVVITTTTTATSVSAEKTTVTAETTQESTSVTMKDPTPITVTTSDYSTTTRKSTRAPNKNTTTTPKPTTTTKKKKTTTTTKKTTTTTKKKETTTTTKKTTTVPEPVYPDEMEYIGEMMVKTEHGGDLSLWNGPDKKYGEVGADDMPPGTRVRAYASEYNSSTDTDWYYICFDGYWGWSNGRYLFGDSESDDGYPASDIEEPYEYYDPEDEDMFCHVTKKSGLAFRKSPEKKGSLIATIPYGSALEVYGINSDGTWSYVYYNGGYGWVSSADLEYDYFS